MAEVSQRPEPGSGRWSFLRRLPKFVKRGESPKPAALIAEEQRMQQRRERISSLVNDLILHYGMPGLYKDKITGPDGQEATLETDVSDITTPWMVKYGSLGWVRIHYRNSEGHNAVVTCSKAGPVSEDPRTEAEKGIIFAGDVYPGQFPKHMTDDETMDIWEKWEPAIRDFIRSTGE